MDDYLFYFSETQIGHIRTRHHDDGAQQYFFTNTHAHERKQIGAVEACWTHNPEVGGSKPLSAKRKYRTAITPATKLLF